MPRRPEPAPLSQRSRTNLNRPSYPSSSRAGSRHPGCAEAELARTTTRMALDQRRDARCRVRRLAGIRLHTRPLPVQAYGSGSRHAGSRHHGLARTNVERASLVLHAEHAS